LGHLTLSLPDAHATRALGARLAAASPAGTLILLRGPLGAGKTTLVEGAVRELGAGHAASPTFVIAHEYRGGKMPVSHLDLYRLEDPRDVEALDLAAYLRSDGITLVEWPERAAEQWPADRIEVELIIAARGREARISIIGALESAVALEQVAAT
jgi:tRNA threonylcarbamoyl adenosine modification protein YjeE